MAPQCLVLLAGSIHRKNFMNSLMPAFLIELPAYAGGFDGSEPCICEGRFAPTASLL